MGGVNLQLAWTFDMAASEFSLHKLDAISRLNEILSQADKSLSRFLT